MTQIFVFGSNTAGRHGKGAALVAKQKWGAVQGVGEGRTGNAYAIPTKRESRTELYPWGLPRLKPRSLDSILESIVKFNRYAKEYPELTFIVTEIGCGRAGYSAHEIAPLFQTATKLQNVFLPERFVKVLLLNRDKISFDVNQVLQHKEAKK